MRASSTRSRGCIFPSGSRSASTARGYPTAPRNGLRHALLVAALDVFADGHVADGLVPGALVVGAQRLVPRHAVEAQIRLPGFGGVLFRPAQQVRAGPGAWEANGETVQVPGVGGIAGPEDRVVPLHDERADNVAVDLGEPGLAGFDRRHHPVGVEPLRPLLDTTRLQPRCRVAEYVEDDVEFVGPRRADLHSLILVPPS